MEESILRALQEQTLETAATLSESATPTAEPPYVLKCRRELSELKIHMTALRRMLKHQEKLENALFQCQHGMSFEAAIQRPSPLIGEPNWAGRFSAEQLRDKRNVIDAMLAQIGMILGVKD